MLALIKKELSSFFLTPIGYVFLAIFWFFCGFYFFATVIASQNGELSGFYQSLFMVILISIPVLTMRIFTEEFKNKTDQLLFSSPISLTRIVLGKFFGVLIMFAIASLICVVYTVIVSVMASTSFVTIIGYNLGFLLLGMTLISIGIFISSLTSNQIIAAFGAFGVFLFLMYLDTFAQFMPFEWLQTLFSKLSFMGRYRNFISGMLNPADVVYFLSVTFLFLFFTVRVLDKKRWS